MQEPSPEAASPETPPSCRLRSPSGGSLAGGGEAPPRSSPSTAATQSQVDAAETTQQAVRVGTFRSTSALQSMAQMGCRAVCYSLQHPSAGAPERGAAPWLVPLLLRGRSCGEERALLAASPSRSSEEPSGTASTMEWRPPAHRLITRHRPGPPAAGPDTSAPRDALGQAFRRPVIDPQHSKAHHALAPGIVP